MAVGIKIETGVPSKGTIYWVKEGDNNNNNNNRRKTAMMASAIPNELYEYEGRGIWSALTSFFSQIVLLMSDARPRKNTKLSDDRSPAEKFWDYLDGYLFGFDLYPVCERHLFVKNDAYAILQDFWAVGAALNNSTQELIKSPEVVLREQTADDDIRRRKIKAAKSAIAAIRSAKEQRTLED